MYGNCQWRKAVSSKKGQTLRLEKIDLEAGETVELDEILMLVDGDKINVGKPTVSGAKIIAKVEKHGRGDKIEVLKFKRRKHHMKHMGHNSGTQKLKG